MLHGKATLLRDGALLAAGPAGHVPAPDGDDRPLRRSTLRTGWSRRAARRARAFRARDLGLAAGIALIATAVVACLPVVDLGPGRPAVAVAARPAPAPVAEVRLPAPAVPASFAILSEEPPAAVPPVSGETAAAPAGKIRSARLEDAPALPAARQPAPRGPATLRHAVTRLVGFDTAPFPYDGIVPATQQPFLNTEQGEERGHRSARGRLFLESETFADNRVLAHIPQGFDLARPGVMVVFFHGHGATLKRDVLNRQQVPAQVSASGANAVLVAPQFAVDASDSSAGRFWEQGGFARFLDESARQLARLHGGGAAAEKAFSDMPVILVSYSGGFVPAAYALQPEGGAQDRVRGLVLLDSIYGEADRFAAWAASGRGKFLVNASTPYTRRGAGELERQLAARDVPVTTELRANISRGATFLNTGADANHRDYVTQAWTERPIADLLGRLPEYRLRGDAVAALDRPAKQRSAAAQ